MVVMMDGFNYNIYKGNIKKVSQQTQYVWLCLEHHIMPPPPTPFIEQDVA